MKKRLFVLYSILIILSTVTSSFSMGAKPQKPEKQERPFCETDYPIILVPGVLGFDSVFGVIDYYYGIADSLEKDGAIVYTVALTGLSGTEQRGKQLLEFMDKLIDDHPEYTKFNVIGHSHGATTARYAMYDSPELFASLTSIAGPHQGTPFADYLNEKIPDPLTTIALAGAELLLGDFVALISGNFEHIGTQDAKALVDTFTRDGIENFNFDYPCAGVPKGATKGSYGDDADTVDGEFYGNGTGKIPAPGEHSIRFYSWTGNIGQKSVTWLDPIDISMVLTNSFLRGYGYKGDADAFVPVSSSHFGEVVKDNYNWNHVDEVNHSMGFVNPFSANPVAVFRIHAQKLQKAGY